jgi:hypothetical protein
MKNPTLPLVAALLALHSAQGLHAAPLKSAEITAMVNDVKVVNPDSAPQPAKVNEVISGQTGLQTGIKSRAELIFTDKTLARLGANTLFSFTEGTRDIDLKQGTMLLQVPKNAGGAQIRTAAVTAAITGTTILIEHFPGNYAKVIVLEGTLRLFKPGKVGESILIKAGQMVIMNPAASRIPDPVDVDIQRLIKTSKLIDKFGPKQDIDRKLVNEEVALQKELISKGTLIETNLVIYGKGTDVVMTADDVLAQTENANEPAVLEQRLADPGQFIPVPPSDNKGGPLVTADSSDPFPIDGTTTVVTDPVIKTGKATANGVIFNIAAINPAVFMFGSETSADTFTNFSKSADFNVTGDLMAAFRFQGLEISGDPSINTTGGPAYLALAALKTVDVLPASYTFSGLKGLFIVGQQGVSVHQGVTITNPALDLGFYSRGAGTTLAYEAQTAVSALGLLSGGDINVGSFAEIKAQHIGIKAVNNVFIDSLVQGGAVKIKAGNNLTLGANGYIKGDDVGVSVLGASSSLLIDGRILAASHLTAEAETLFLARDITESSDLFAGSGGIVGSGFSAANVNSLQTSNGGNVDVQGIGSTGTGLWNIAGSLSSINSINAPSTGIMVKNGIQSFGGFINANSISSGGSISAQQNILTQGDLIAIGNITSAQGSIFSQNGFIEGSHLVLNTPGNQIAAPKGNINADIITGPLSSGNVTVKARNIIETGGIQNRSGTVLLRAPTIHLSNASGGDSGITSFQIDDNTRILKNLLIFSSGPFTLSLSNDLGTFANPVNSITFDPTVTFSGSGHDLYVGNMDSGDLSVRDLYAVNLNTGAGALTAQSINRTQDRNASHFIVVGGAIDVANGLLFGGNPGAQPEDGGSLTLTVSSATFGTSPGMIKGADFHGGQSTTSANGGKGGSLIVVTQTGDLATQPGASLSANGGPAPTVTAIGGPGGSISLATPNVSGRVASINSVIGAQGGDGATGGHGGSLDFVAPHLDFLNSANISVGGGSGSSGPGAMAGFITVRSDLANGNITTFPTATFSAQGGNSAAGPGGAGSQIAFTLTGTGGSMNLQGSINAQGGSSSASFKGGSGGLILADSISAAIQVSANVNATGGDATVGNAEGGDGGTIKLLAPFGTVGLNPGAFLYAGTGKNHGTVVRGGRGGTVQITANSTTLNNATVKAGSDDPPNSFVTQDGGSIQVTANETNTAKPGITIQNSSQLLALLSAASAGEGGKIVFTSSGGQISVNGSTITASANSNTTNRSTVDIRNTAGGGAIDITSSTISSDVVKIGALGNQGKLTITAGSFISANNQLKLFGGNASGGSVLFTGAGTVNLTSASNIIDANRVEVSTGTTVNNTGATSINAAEHAYSAPGKTPTVAGTYGSFNNNVTRNTGTYTRGTF